MLVVRLGSGAWGDVRVIASKREEVPVLDFLQSLDRSQGKAVRKMMALLMEKVPAQGPPKHNRERCRHLDNGIYEFKVNQVRVFWFYDHEDGAAVVCSHGFSKKTQKTPPREIKRAKDLRRQYQRARVHGSLVIEDLDGEESGS